MNQALRNVLLLEGESVNQNEDARVADAPDKRAPDVNRQVHAQADPDGEARADAPRSAPRDGPHPYLFISI